MFKKIAADVCSRLARQMKKDYLFFGGLGTLMIVATQARVFLSGLALLHDAGSKDSVAMGLFADGIPVATFLTIALGVAFLFGVAHLCVRDGAVERVLGKSLEHLAERLDEFTSVILCFTLGMSLAALGWAIFGADHGATGLFIADTTLQIQVLFLYGLVRACFVFEHVFSSKMVSAGVSLLSAVLMGYTLIFGVL